jgi:hypothetical protein
MKGFSKSLFTYTSLTIFLLSFVENKIILNNLSQFIDNAYFVQYAIGFGAYLYLLRVINPYHQKFSIKDPSLYGLLLSIVISIVFFILIII